MKTIRFRDTQIDFQEACVHCLRWAGETHPFERTFFFGRRSVLVQIPAPLCSEHLRLANKKSPTQTWCDRVGLLAGAVIGVAVCAGLLSLWSANAVGNSILNILLAGFVGISMFVTTWAITHFWLTPLFASAETKTVLNSLRITKYDPFRSILELTFTNDTSAELARRANLDILAEDLSGFRRFQVSAHLLSHDVRLSTTIKTVLPLDHAPSLDEARKLLQPVIDMVMARNHGEDCFYELDSVEVRELS